ncbi:uncharacterized protein Z518_01722 [Rhinocladiella mackenziei CBS 650.93]|uniref:Transcription factor domain-containing protein n=1 Tax=Rhinocladiella mackenziei CBS 650.93 TaxID=1442369 RepID=A0A0D2HIZ6_9EURO|nr:uncharacterized protein Z518_01722 [Rhinocladiella mackenziei CBS 650.93]KIX10638.1 hypothetical protein Z518_01722 [Rhinocladiella mackenziei CBS 650.93]
MRDRDSNALALEKKADRQIKPSLDSREGRVGYREGRSKPSENRNILDPRIPSFALAAQVNSNPEIRQQLLELYLHYHLPTRQLGPIQQRLWLLRLPSMTHLTPALEVSTMALCLGKLGDVHQDQGLRRESLKLYYHGLRQLQKALWDLDLMFHDQTLATCIALASYEMSQCPGESRNGYISHAAGCEKLVQLRGPEAHTDGLGHQIFVLFRVQGILLASVNKKSTFLSEPLWQEVPFRKEPKRPYDHVYDYLNRASELLNRGEMLDRMNMDAQLQLATEMISQCWKMDQELLTLYEELETTQSGPVFWPELAQQTSFDHKTEDGMVFPVAFHFPDLFVASTVVVFWAVQSMLWYWLSALYGLMDELRVKLTAAGRVVEVDEIADISSTSVLRPRLREDTFNLPPLEYRINSATPALNILQSVEYFLQEDMLDHGPKSIAAPLKAAMEILRLHSGYKTEMLWAEEAMRKVQGRSLRLLVYYSGVEK